METTENEIKLSCYVERVTYQNPNGFGLLACSLSPFSSKNTGTVEQEVKKCINKKYNTFTVSVKDLEDGIDPSGKEYIFVGNFAEHTKYGRQFESKLAYLDIPQNKSGFRAFLETLPHIKRRRSEAILNRWSIEEIKVILSEEPQKLCEINGITSSRAKVIQKHWENHSSKMAIYLLFNSLNVSANLVEKAFKKWGHKTVEVIEQNPYNIAELSGVTFVSADTFALNFYKSKKIEINSAHRLKACIFFHLKEAYYKDSQVCVPYRTIKKNVLDTMSDCNQFVEDETDYAEIFPSVLKTNLDTFQVVQRVESKKMFLYLRSVWDKECFVAAHFNACGLESLDKISEAIVKEKEKDLSDFYNKDFSLDDKQVEAIMSAFNNRLTVITGGGGTGKTTICKCIYDIAQDQHLSVKMMSPTGKAAQVLSDKTGCEAQTIHRALKIAPGDDFTLEELMQDIILVDEVSMTGLDLIYAICCAVQNNDRANIVFVGDKNQLPSVSPGNFLENLIESNCASVVELDKIHRQEENSYITVLADQMSKGVNKPIPKEATDISWHDASTSCERLIEEFLDRYLLSDSMENLQCISPMKKGEYGVNNLNKIIQDRMKKENGVNEKDSLEISFSKFYLKDRVIQMINNYEKSVFNGDMGEIIALGKKVRDDEDDDTVYHYITVSFYGTPVTYYGKEIENLKLGWAITVHKYQGSQSKNIVLFLCREASIMMSKELVYTGYTRAEKHLYLFGHTGCLDLAANKSALKLRHTNFVPIIEQANSIEHEIIKSL